MTVEDRLRLRELLSIIAPYPEHLKLCAHWSPQTAEYCDCGLRLAYEAYKEAFRILDK